MCIYEHNIHNDKKAGYFLQKRGIASKCILFPVALCLCIGVKGFPDSSVGKESTHNAGDPGSIPGSGRSSAEGLGYSLQYSWTSLVAQLIKNLPAKWETWVWSLGWEDPLRKGKATHSSILASRIPWTAAHGVTKSQHEWATFTFIGVKRLTSVVNKRKTGRKWDNQTNVEIGNQVKWWEGMWG